MRDESREKKINFIDFDRKANEKETGIECILWCCATLKMNKTRMPQENIYCESENEFPIYINANGRHN